MKTFRFLFLFILVLQINEVSAQIVKSYDSKADRKKFYDEISEKYTSEDIRKIWNSDAKDQIFDQWVDGRLENEVVAEFSTVIHELFHGICESVDKGQKYYINKDVVIYVPYTETYRSTQLNSFVRQGQQDSIFRYCLYVGGKNILPDGSKTDKVNTSEKDQASSIQIGIYGMLEEFSAYYHGTLVNNELEKYYAEVFKENGENGWLEFKENVLGDAIAYYEFKLFMSWYLVYAKKSYPKIYKELINNQSLRVVYTLMISKYEKLLEQIDQKIKAHVTPPGEEDLPMTFLSKLDFSGSDEDIVRFLEMTGITEDDEIYSRQTKLVNGKETVTIKILDKEFFNELKNEYDYVAKQMQQFRKSTSGMVDSKGNNMVLYFSNTELQEDYLKKQMTKEMNVEWENFKLKGVTESNYKNFLK